MDGYDASTYGDRFADVYDDWYAEISDVDATVERVAALAGELAPPARGVRRPAVLELGAGSGRLAIPLAARGIEVWAVDASAAMVQRLAAKPGGDRVHALVSDMRVLALGGAPPFAVVLCAFNTLFNLTSTDDQRRCLREVARVLAPGGRFVVEAFVPPLLDEDAPPVDSVEPRHIGLDEVVLGVSRLEPATRMITGQFVQITEAGIRLRPWVLHYASPDQLDELAASAGLALAERHGDWHGTPFTDASTTHVSSYAHRPG